jgi:hypothetical protein
MGRVRKPEHEEGIAIARIPTGMDLSRPSGFRSGRVIAEYDTSGLARGIQSLGNSIERIGADIQQQRDTVDLARAEAYKTKGFIDVTNEFSEDGDYSTFGKRAPEKTGEVVNKAANLIRNPQLREKWQINANTDAVRTNDAINDRGRSLGKQAETVAFDDALEVNRRIYVDPETPEEAKAKAKADIEGAIAIGEQNGLLTPEQAASRRDTYIKNAEFSRAKLAVERDPNIISAPLPRTVNERVGTAMSVLQSLGWSKEQAAGIVGNLVAESKLNTSAVNPGDGADGSDSIGIAQWNSTRARALKDFAASKGTDWQDLGTQIAFIDHELRNSPSERAAFEALKNSADPKAAAEAMIMYERPRGSDKGVQNAHNYRGRVSAAMQAAGLEANPEWFKTLSPEQRQVVYDQAETRRRQIAVEQQGAIENVVQNAPVAIQNTGSYDGQLPDRQQFIDAYGMEDGGERYNKFSAAVEVSEQAYGFRTMSADDIQAAVENAVPTSSGDSAALEAARYDALQKAATTTLAARNADPATYAQQAFPVVERSWEEAQTTGNYQPALSAMAAAQTQLGIKDMKLLPKAVAERSVTSFKDGTLNGQERLNAVAGLVFSTPDNSQRQAVFKQLVDAGLPQTMEGVFEAMARGDQGAAARLMEAVTVDPAKLPTDRESTPAMINESIYGDIWAPGEIGYTAYGLSYGDASSLERAQRGTELMNKAVRLRMSRGEDMQTAISGAKKDLFGDKVVFEGMGDVSADLAIPADVDAGALNNGLAASRDIFRQALTAQRDRILGSQDLPTADGQKAIIGATTENRINDIMANGVFVMTGNGIGLRDPFTGQFVAGENGQPLTLSMDDILSRAPEWEELQRSQAPTVNSLGGWAGRARQNRMGQ